MSWIKPWMIIFRKSVVIVRLHYADVTIATIESQITSLAIVFSTVYLDTDHRKHQSSASLAFVWGIHRGPVNSPHKWPVTQKMFPFDDVIMSWFGYKMFLVISCNPISIRYDVTFSKPTRRNKPYPPYLKGEVTISYWTCGCNSLSMICLFNYSL